VGRGGRTDIQVLPSSTPFPVNVHPKVTEKFIGCACDIASHSYQYSFDPNPNWSAFYAPAKEICGYLQAIADKYGVMRHVKLLHKVTSCKWDEQARKWYGWLENLQGKKLIL